MSILNNQVLSGDTAQFDVGVEIEAGEVLDIQHLALDLSGPISMACLFLPNGTKISSCKGIIITPIPPMPNNYGYGFEEGNLEYRIEFDTTFYPVGIYSTELIVFEASRTIRESGDDLEILAEPNALEKCSVRAENGVLMMGAENLGSNNDLSFSVPTLAASTGKGSLVSQKSGIRFLYSFDIIETIQNKPGSAILLTSGTYRINRNTEVPQTALLYLDKVNEEVDIVAGDFEAKDLEIDFILGCK